MDLGNKPISLCLSPRSRETATCLCASFSLHLCCYKSLNLLNIHTHSPPATCHKGDIYSPIIHNVCVHVCMTNACVHGCYRCSCSLTLWFLFLSHYLFHLFLQLTEELQGRSASNEIRELVKLLSKPHVKVRELVNTLLLTHFVSTYAFR